MYPTWNMLNVNTGVPENPLGILLAVHIGASVADSLPLVPVTGKT